MAHILDCRPSSTHTKAHPVFDVFAVADADWPTFNALKDACHQFQATRENGMLDGKGDLIVAQVDSLIVQHLAAKVIEDKRVAVDAALDAEYAKRKAAVDWSKTGADAVAVVFPVAVAGGAK